MPKREGMLTPAHMEQRVVRFGALVPCFNAFIDTRTPGSERKENFTIIGPGVSENPSQYVHIPEPHGFNIGGARQPPGCMNSQHSHDSAEVFVVHSGHWRFDLGERGDAARVNLAPGDVISLRTRMFRGFTNIGENTGFLWAVLGGDDPGRVTWAPRVFDMAREYGLVLLEDGSLIDTSAGQTVPEGIRPMPRTTPEQVAALAIPTQAEAEAMVVRKAFVGQNTTPIIGPGAPLGWPHGFTLGRLDLPGSANVGKAAHDHPTVAFLHRGAVHLQWDGGTLELGEGDTISIPQGVVYRIRTTAPACMFVVQAAKA